MTRKIERDDVDYMMETFPIVKRKDEKLFRDYRTKRVILEMYDEMRRGWCIGRGWCGGGGIARVGHEGRMGVNIQI